VPVLKPPFDELGAGGTRIAKSAEGSEMVPAGRTYFEWLKTQPPEFQDSALGPRRAELLRNGGLTAERFAELNLGRNFEPRTLDEIRKLEPMAFLNVDLAQRDGLTLSSGSVGDEKDGSVILEVGTVDFNDHKAVMAEIDGFAEKYAYADVEHALTITTDGEKYITMGQRTTVDPSVIGEGLLKGSVGIHNQPLLYGGDSYDSFSRSDLKFAAEHGQGKQYLISGARRNAFELTESHTPVQVDEAWDNALNHIRQKHMENDTEVISEQEEIMMVLNKYLKGFRFYENF